MLMLCIIRYQFTEVTGPLNTSNGNGWKTTAPQQKNHTLEKKNVVGLQVTKTMQLTEAKELTTKLCVINKKIKFKKNLIKK